jgi:pilus assembly protein CpaC
MRALFLVRRLCLLVGLAAFIGLATTAGRAQDQVGLPSTDPITIDRPMMDQISVVLPLNKARVVYLPVDARDVLATNSNVADVILKSPRIVYILGNKVGSTNVLFIDSDGHQIARLDIRVETDLSALDAMLDLLMPDENIDVISINENVALTGTVSTPQVSANALTIAQRFVPPESIVNLLNVRNEQQVLLKVRFTEMNREAVKEFGIDTSWFPGFNPFGINFGILSGTGDTANTFGQIQASTDRLNTATNALEQSNLVRTLAEPSVTAISGEAASVLVGGEFPIPVPGSDNTVTIEFREFGVVLEFTPVVLSDERISLHVNTEVSATTTTNAVTVQGFVIPALTVRRATTSVDLPSGGSLVIAGLLQNDINTSVSGFPGLMDLPVLGTLFRSTQFQRQETELVVLVTPYIVRPVSPNDIAFPTDGFAPSSDIELYFLGRVASVYAGREEIPVPGEMPAEIGFIVE